MFKKILLINPKHLCACTAPSPGLAWIAASLENRGIETVIFDCQVIPDYKKELNNYLENYDVLGITANVATINSAIEIASLIRAKKPKAKIIMGGPYPTLVYERLIPRYADVVAVGEGENTIVELSQLNDLSKVKGIAYWDNGLKVNPQRDFIEDINICRYPAWHLFDLQKYKMPAVRRPFAIMMTSWGCPYQCIFCSRAVHGTKIRLRAIDNVLAEVDYLITHGIREIHISDDNFTFYPERVKEFCKEIIKQKYRGVRFALPGGIRADITDPEMFKLMANANFYFVRVAIESGSQAILNKVGKNLNLQVVEKIIKMIKKERIGVSAFFMIGLPFDNIETMEATINFAKKLPLDQAIFTIALPLPGTKFYKIVQEDGKFLYDLFSDSNWYTAGRAIYEIGGLKAEDVERMFRKAYKDFYLRPAQIYRTLTRQIEPFSTLEIIKYSFKCLGLIKRI